MTAFIDNILECCGRSHSLRMLKPCSGNNKASRQEDRLYWSKISFGRNKSQSEDDELIRGTKLNGVERIGKRFNKRDLNATKFCSVLTKLSSVGTKFNSKLQKFVYTEQNPAAVNKI